MALLRGMPDAGADLIEIGMPFTDPMADGPIIQAAGKRGLPPGVKVRRRPDHGARLPRGRQRHADRADGLPQPDPVLRAGTFCGDAAAAGVDGLIVVDLPTEEADLLLPFSAANGLDFIRLVAPTTDDARLPQVLNGSSGFVYYVSITGITGTRSATAEHLEQAIPRLRRATDLPIAIGFGVRTPEQAGVAARIADAAVVASALIETLSQNLDPGGKVMPGAVEKVLDQVRGLAAAVRTG